MHEVIPILRVADVGAAIPWYERLGYEQEWEHRFGPSFPAFVSLARDGTARLFLSEHQGDGSTPSVVYLRINDVDVVAAEFGTEVDEQPWARETHLTDPDGNQIRVGTPSSPPDGAVVRGSIGNADQVLPADPPAIS